MSDSGQQPLFDLQRIDLEIRRVQQRIAAFEPRLDEVEQPYQELTTEEESLRKRLQELKLDERRLTTSSGERRVRLDRLQERLNQVRNLREEAAVHAEADLVRRALEADEQEAFGVMDLVQKAEERLIELQQAMEGARAEIEPQREGILAERGKEEETLASLEAERSACASRVEKEKLALYDRIKAGGRAVAVSHMTEDGACGVCFNVIPLQLQNEVRQGESLLRCEACGVILAPPAPEADTAADEGSADAPPEDAVEGDAAEASEAAGSVAEPE